MDKSSTIQAIISNDHVRRRLLEIVRSLNLPDCWIGAGFVRNAVWDYLHARDSSPVSTDVDVIWFDGERCTPKQDDALEAFLRNVDPSVKWSVKNQARMHVQNGDDPYQSATDAMRYWPETATAVAVRMLENGTCEVAAPLGLEDLFDLVIRPAGRFATEKNAIYQKRVKSKSWLEVWPMLTLLELPRGSRSSR
ncbi:nucleotidyltransferase family protein [Pseudomonas shirazica]|uniref:Nucleotidyltransferase family protein n=1 Tax=Pseudomonas shirazica TaxID=1940636 RepID=A0ABY9SVE6_9PSED|nr:nucleotidyltransferase family protein [Pseudomonas shirazica]WMY87541.1 nucleotidyltransferase family protein [Pseudomonas shirazica]